MPRAAHIRAQTKTRGAAVIASSTMLRAVLGRRYLARVRAQSRAAAAAATRTEFCLFFNIDSPLAGPVVAPPLQTADQRAPAPLRASPSSFQSGEKVCTRLGNAML